MFPCSFSGVVTLTLSWTILDIPLDLRGLVGLNDLHMKLDTQLITLCLGNMESSKLSPAKCLAEITESLDAMVMQRCSELVLSPGSPTVGLENASLWSFRKHVAHALRLPSPAWTAQDLDVVPGWVNGQSDDPLDHCGAVWDRLPRPEEELPLVLVVGQYLAIDRDYLLRDLLGCVPRVRYCVESEADAAAARDMLAYEEARRPYAAASRFRVATEASVGPCEPPSRPRRSGAAAARQPAVVLVRNLNRWGDPQHPGEQQPIQAVLLPLLDKWRPQVFIHLSEEVPRVSSDELSAAYARCRLVLRPYYHHHAPDFVRMLARLPHVIIVPLGYGAGTYAATRQALPAAAPGTGVDASTARGLSSAAHGGARSGVTAALAWVVGTDGEGPGRGEGRGRGGGGSGAGEPSRELAWAFAGRLGVHGSRPAMTNVWTAWAPYERALDQGGRFAGGGPLAPPEVSALYQRARFVASPPGNSPDCFRHYEATVNGAVVALDGRPTDYAWWRAFYGLQSDAAQAGDQAAQLGPFPAPLGWLFDGASSSVVDDGPHYSETAAERAERDAAGFILHRYTLTRRSAGQARRGRQGDRGGLEVGRYTAEAEVEGEAESTGELEAKWRALLGRSKVMGAEEVALRRDLNARFYCGTITAARTRVQAALFGTSPELQEEQVEVGL